MDTGTSSDGVERDAKRIPFELEHRSDRASPTALISARGGCAARNSWWWQVSRHGGRGCLLFRTAADVGGVGGPVCAGGLLPCDGDFDVDAEHPGEDRGG